MARETRILCDREMAYFLQHGVPVSASLGYLSCARTENKTRGGKTSICCCLHPEVPGQVFSTTRSTSAICVPQHSCSTCLLSSPHRKLSDMIPAVHNSSCRPTQLAEQRCSLQRAIWPSERVPTLPKQLPNEAEVHVTRGMLLIRLIGT